jgi:UDP-N-acetylmuramoyl-L-alanyl-D-glutamate--2,6-diaminopimelate ligase
MRLKELLHNLVYTIIQGDDNLEIMSIAWDSRNVEKQSLFICVKGKTVDRHDYALIAIQAGAVALVVEHDIENVPPDITIIKVKDTKSAMASIAGTFYDNPTARCNFIGVIGSLGKSSTAWILAKLLSLCGRKAGIIDNINSLEDNEKIAFIKSYPNVPDSIKLNYDLNELVSSGVTEIITEISPTALLEYKYYGCKFKICLLLNSNQDLDNYFFPRGNIVEQFSSLIQETESFVTDTLNTLNANLSRQAQALNLVTYGIEPNKEKDISADNIIFKKASTVFDLNFPDRVYQMINYQIPGKSFLNNLLASITCCYQLGIRPEKIISAIADLNSIKGRFETVKNPRGHLIIIDSAYTPFALKNLLITVRDITPGKILTVFGCGGDRDKKRRQELGKAAGAYSDYCIITTDNPRTEEPLNIINDIEEGLKKTGCAYEKIEDRKTAIFKALAILTDSDALVISGKGQETYQVFMNHIKHFNDRETVDEYFNT